MTQAPSPITPSSDSVRARLERARERALQGQAIGFTHGVGLDAMVTFLVPAELALPCIEHALSEIE